MKKLTLQEIKDTLVGCTILGTGGGGSLESGLEAVEKAWNAGHEFKLLSFDEINDDSYYANPYYCGSIVPKGDTSQKRGDEIATSVKARTGKYICRCRCSRPRSAGASVFHLLCDGKSHHAFLCRYFIRRHGDRHKR